jgi:SAM-dependent methyltransferase
VEPREGGDPQHRFWHDAFAGSDYYYGAEPGPVARRAVRYHRPRRARPETGRGTALDAGCGEGQDLRFLAERGYRATGLDFTATGIAKARRLLQERELPAELIRLDLRDLGSERDPLVGRQFDLVLAVNALQFMGADASDALDGLRNMVRPGGVIGLSLFAREGNQPEVRDGIWFIRLPDLLARFQGWQPMEAANLWQWHPAYPNGQAFVTLIAARGEGTTDERGYTRIGRSRRDRAG